MHTIYALVIWGVFSGDFPSKYECIQMGNHLKTIDATVEFDCKFKRGRVSWQQLK